MEQAWQESGRSPLDELFEAITPRDGSEGDLYTAAMLAPHAWAEIKRLREKRQRECPELSVEEATAFVSAALSEDHDSASLDRAIKRLGDWVDAQLAAEESWCDGSGIRQIQVQRTEPDCCGNVNSAGECRGDCAVSRQVQDTDFENCPGCPRCQSETEEATS